MNGSLENKETFDGASSQLRPPSQNKCISDESVGPASSIQPPANLVFNLENYKKTLQSIFEAEMFQTRDPQLGFPWMFHPCKNVLSPAGFDPTTLGIRGGLYSGMQHDFKRKVKHFFYRTRQFKKTRTMGERRLLQAASLNKLGMVAALLHSGVDLNVRDVEERSPLLLAARRGCSEVVRLLLEKGADPNLRDTCGNNALHLAAHTNNVRVVTMLLDAGTDLRNIDNQGRSPLQVALLKLKQLQRGETNENSNLVTEARQVVEIMLLRLKKTGGQKIEAGIIGCFHYSRLLLSHIKEAETGVSDLLPTLANLSLEIRK
ncbi:hypothetical protein L9F63_004502 [Diploptera punctata]|uniref:Ankyrin repeat domain-containing protein 54 n=1 Tax=Diploptera punctata TaxID=6984 RepID=A0AAD7ZFR5_DIPPU|nr:hypothetical protein L9F63_004502 [Diploptera punctata]